VRRFQGLCDRYGVETVLAAGDELLDYAERKMRAGIAALPDGRFTFEDVFDGIDIDEPMPLRVAITIAGEDMTLDFDAPPQVRAGINMTMTALQATCFYIVKSVVDPTILPNSGLSRPLTITAPKGSILNCAHPAAVNGRVQTCQRVADLVLGALAEAVPERASACTNSACTVATFAGTRTSGPDAGKLWVYLETIGGGGGARAGKDGLDGIHVHVTNTSNLPVEALELEYPLVLERYELVEGSAGAGRHRGGMGLRRVYRATEECRVSVDIARTHSRSWGLAGGAPGGGSHFRVNVENGSFRRGDGILNPGDWLEVVSPGGGGYGPLAERAADALARDGEDHIGLAG